MVWTQFALNKAQNKDGIAYAELIMTPLQTIPREQASISKKIAEKLLPILRDEVSREEL